MLYCDLDIDTTNIWSGILCLDLDELNGGPAQGFEGALYFADTQGSQDPDYTGLGSRYVLCYQDTDGNVTSVPTQAVPNQQLTVALGTQNCTIRLYTRTATLTT
jgi:hypothetical protein